MEEQKTKKPTADLFFGAFGLFPENVVTIAWSLDRNIIVILKKDGERVKFEDEKACPALLKLLPNEYEFVGFQHATEGISFDAFAKLSH